MKIPPKSLILLLGSFFFVLNSATAAPPNVVVIFADDLGNNEVGFSNSTRGLLTPNIDRLAAGGVALSNYYVTPLCSPTVSLTPRSCWRSLCSPWPAITHTG